MGRRTHASPVPVPDWSHESAVWARGVVRLAGVDEAGRGPLAGPVVAAAVVFTRPVAIAGLLDSKRLTPAERTDLARAIRTVAAGWAVGVAEAWEIDALDILRATHLAMERALRALDPPADFALIDGLPTRALPCPQQAIVGGDGRCASIAAASILAKTHRDALLCDLDARYPGYGFARHKGYPTPEHLRALRERGPTPVHRRSFRPVAELGPPYEEASARSAAARD